MPSDRSRQLIQQAIEALGSGKYSDALKVLDEADDQGSDSAEIFELRGIAFAQTGRAEAATESFRKAAMVAPSARSYFNLAVHYYNIGEAEDCLETVRKCLKLDPSHTEAMMLVARLSGQGNDPQFSAEGKAIDPTAMAYKRRYGFGRRHLFAVMAENQEQWIATGWGIIILSIVSALMMKVISPFHVPPKFNDHDILGGLRPIAAPYAFATIAFFLTMVLASMIWTSLDLIDRRGKALWMIPMMLCCFTCAPSLAQALYMVIGRRDST